MHSLDHDSDVISTLRDADIREVVLPDAGWRDDLRVHLRIAGETARPQCADCGADGSRAGSRCEDCDREIGGESGW